MRSAFATAALLGAAALASSQERPTTPDTVPPRFGVAFRAKLYPQATPKQAIESVIAAADKGEFNYLVAQLLDPAFVDARVGDRARQFQSAIEADLAQAREVQLRNPNTVTPENQIPTDPAKFRERVAADARASAFRQIVRDIQDRLADDPEVLKDLRRFNRQGTFPEAAAAGDTAKIGLPDIRDRAVYLKKSGDRWFIENRQTDDRPPEAKKE